MPVADSGLFAGASTRDRTAGLEAANAYDALIAKEPVVDPGGGLLTLRDEIHAWAAFSQGDSDTAAGLLSTVAARERKVGKCEVELPACEILAEIRLLDGKAVEALQAYQLSLSSNPNRFNGLLGAARAAELAGQAALAAGYYSTLLTQCKDASGASSGGTIARPCRMILERNLDVFTPS